MHDTPRQWDYRWVRVIPRDTGRV